MDKASKIVGDAITGMDFKTVVVNNKAYTIHPPTIHKLAGAGSFLSGVNQGETIADVIKSLNDSDKLAHALSWFINGDDSLYKELSQGTYNDIVEGLEAAYSLISVENFFKLSVLMKNVSSLTARRK